MLASAFLIVALILFVLAAAWNGAPGQLVPAGLAFLAASFLVASGIGA